MSASLNKNQQLQNFGMKQPSVSVIVSVYNGAAYLHKAIQSVLGQTFSDLEFLIIDDGSSDGSIEIVETYAEKDSRVKFEKNSRNRGVGYAYSRLLEKAVGEFFAQIGQDDIWEPTFLELLVFKMKEDSGLAVTFSDVMIIDRHGNPSQVPNPFRYNWIREYTREQLVCAFLKGNFLCAASSLARRSMCQNWHTIGDNDQLQDWNHWLHMILCGRFELVENKLVQYRIHGANLSNGSHSSALIRIEMEQTRHQFLVSNEFWNFFSSRRDKHEFLNELLKTYFEVTSIHSEIDFANLFFALRSHEHEYRNLDVYQNALGFLFWRAGAFAKANRYLSLDAKAWIHATLSSESLRSIRFRTFVLMAPKVVINESSLLHHIQFGPLMIGRIYSYQRRPMFRLIPILGIDFTRNKSDRILERNSAGQGILRRIGSRARKWLQTHKVI